MAQDFSSSLAPRIVSTGLFLLFPTLRLACLSSGADTRARVHHAACASAGGLAACSALRQGADGQTGSILRRRPGSGRNNALVNWTRLGLSDANRLASVWHVVPCLVFSCLSAPPSLPQLGNRRAVLRKSLMVPFNSANSRLGKPPVVSQKPSNSSTAQHQSQIRSSGGGGGGGGARVGWRREARGHPRRPVKAAVSLFNQPTTSTPCVKSVDAWRPSGTASENRTACMGCGEGCSRLSDGYMCYLGCGWVGQERTRRVMTLQRMERVVGRVV
ncbi:hypothetical protein IWZ01DRAFT_296127 [Phyllosticta capitalensis]